MYMEQVLSVLHQLNRERTLVCLSLHGSTREVTLAIEAPKPLITFLGSQLFSAYPDCQLLPEESPTAGSSAVWITSLHGTAFWPIKRYSDFIDSLNRTTADPLSSLLLTLHEIAKQGLRPSIELIIRPASKHAVRLQERLHTQAKKVSEWGEEWLHWYIEWATSRYIVSRSIAWIVTARLRLQRIRDKEHGDTEAWAAASEKLRRQLFETNIRLRLDGTVKAKALARRSFATMAGSLGVFRRFPGFAMHVGSIHRKKTMARMHRHQGFLLSAEELATLWHPPSESVQAPTLSSVEWREMEPPPGIPLPQEADVAKVGKTCFRGQSRSFGIRPNERLRHLALLGKTGMGKTTLMQHLIESDMKQAKGVALIDPHGDLVEGLLRTIPSHRTNDVILFDAADSLHPVAFNLLDCPRPEQKPLVVSGIITAFKKMFGEFWGPRLEYIFRNALLALIDCPGTTLLSVQRFLIDSRYRKTVLAHCTDPGVREFWEVEFQRMPPKLQAEAISPIQNKVGQFTLSPQLRNIIGQPKSALHMREIMDQGKVLLVNLSKGRLGEDASSLLGALLITRLQMAALSRADQPEEKRREFYLYVDEFQNFATDSFATILSEARKYKLGLTVANQYLAQLSEGTLHALFGNVGSMVCFQCGAKDAELLAEQLGGEVQAPELMRLPRYHAYCRLLIDGHPSRPFSMTTIPPKPEIDAERADIVRRVSRRQYTRSQSKQSEETRRFVMPSHTLVP